MPTPTATLTERVAALAEAASNAPAFGGLRQHLTDAADFASALVTELQAREEIETALVAQVNDLTARLEAIEHRLG